MKKKVFKQFPFVHPATEAELQISNPVTPGLPSARISPFGGYIFPPFIFCIFLKFDRHIDTNTLQETMRSPFHN